MIKKPLGLILTALAVFLALMVGGYFTHRGPKSWSMMISMMSLFGYGVLLYYLWYGSLIFWIKKIYWALALLAIPTLILTYGALALTPSVMPAILLAGAAGILNALPRLPRLEPYGKTITRAALLCGLGAFLGLILLASTNFWGGQAASVVAALLGFASLAIYLRFYRKA